MTLRLPFIAAILSLPAGLFAQASLSCSMRPATLVQMRHCYRPLLVFSPTAKDPRLLKQQSALDSAADDMMDRFVLFLPIIAQSQGYQPPLDTPYEILNRKEMASVRARFQVPEGRFSVYLLGEDGRIKLKSTQPVSISQLNQLIDSMPERKIEMQRPHAN
ncbi:DUF4174 domain-containing protein [Pseudacidobacterium ailaaui]|jgi:hypothetical protein|uniref:DUF4174 domain-containing protein n=1 Tax=Pseudacidobacterium ailaaui TaxID=1382359 RepID=UPI000479FB92|nr:DUF4174 domain-containing protein [Pseudacidobacterium ailaaui]MBX6359583.1 DUF4174 domain-containing protein [Pseudacidobacterium ailaaui]MCL6463232.1 DUF4174 domain-containing protein [Pseudacidobacterium ailaaui]